MARLRSRNTFPPRGWRFFEPTTRCQIEGENYRDLMKKVLDHRTYKKLPRAIMPDVEEDVERQICSRLSENECAKEGPNDELRPVDESAVLTVGNVTRFTAAALRWLAKGAQMVPMEQLKKRQEICKSCPLNNPMRTCSCSIFYKSVNALVPDARRDPDLFICSACSCSINAKAQMPLEMVLDADEGRNIQYASGCWVLSEQGK